MYVYMYMYMNFALSQLGCLGVVTCNLHAVARGTNQEHIQKARCGFKRNPVLHTCTCTYLGVVWGCVGGLSSGCDM